MYLSHFHLGDEPFAITSDPRFLWLSPHHEEAFAHLLYAVQQRKGFAVLTGDIGTGKTTLINSVLDRLGDTVCTAVVYNASLDTDELLHYIFRDFGLESKHRTRSESIIELNDWLMQQAEADVNSVIVVDEAQNLSIQTMEDLRLLSNMETAKKKLLQILLVGQPELNAKLARPELAQLQQRIAIRYHLRPFQSLETREYVRHRFRLAGGDPAKVFEVESLDLLHAAAEGVPRVINQICDTALLRAYSKGRQVIDEAFLREVLDEDFAFRQLPAGIQTINPSGIDRRGNVDRPLSEQVKFRFQSLFPALGVSIVLLVAFVIWWLLPRPEATSALAPDPTLAEKLEESHAEMEAMKAQLAVKDSLVVAASAQADAAVRALEEQNRAAVRAAPLARTTVDDGPRILPTDRPGWVKLRIRRADTLMRIVQEHYGRSDWRLVESVLNANPFITNPNTIRIGDELVLPPADKPR